LSIKDEDGLIFSLSNFALSFDPLKLLNNVRKTERDKKKWVVNRTKERKVIDCWYVWSNCGDNFIFFFNFFLVIMTFKITIKSKFNNNLS
jgi:hypothetical protein